jgi:sugar/nucleoside kinase (ribokinase family)
MCAQPFELDAVVIGPLNIDLILVGSAPLEPAQLREWMALSEVTLNAAGSGGYPALVLQRLGLKTGMLSIVADDALGDVIRRELRDAGLDLTRLRTAPAEKSSIAIYMLLFGSKKRPLTGRPVLHQPWPSPLTADDQAYLARARLIHVAGYLHYPQMWTDEIPELLRTARARGQMVSLDPQFPLYPMEGRWMPGVEKLLPHLDVLLVDQDEALNITGDKSIDQAGRTLLAAGARLVIVKRGAEGAACFTPDGRRADEPALPVPESEIADTIGAGDAFDGGVLAALLRGCSPAEAVKVGTYVAALSLRDHGAANALQPEHTIDHLIAQL